MNRITLRLIIIMALVLIAVPDADARKKKGKEQEVAVLEPDKAPNLYKAMPDSHPRSLNQPHFSISATQGQTGIQGIDVSHYQGRINWSEVAKDKKVGYVYLKATEGRDNVDDTYAYNVQEARRNGLKVGAYHFFRPNIPAADQFRNFTRVVDRKTQDLKPIIDVEVTGGVSIATMNARLEELLQMIAREYGTKPIIYTGRNFYNKYIAADSRLRNYQFMIAQYTDDEPILTNGDDYVMWQFTSHGTIRGIRGSVDQSRMHGRHSLSEILYK